jgi:hypothetical protein
MLEPEFVAGELAIAESLPEVVLCVGPVEAETRGVWVDLAADRIHAEIVEQLRNDGKARRRPSPTPPAKAGGA